MDKIKNKKIKDLNDYELGLFIYYLTNERMSSSEYTVEEVMSTMKRCFKDIKPDEM